MRRRTEPRPLHPLIALAAALALHLWVVPEVLRFIVHPPRHAASKAAREALAQPRPESGEAASVETQFLTPDEVAALIGPAPPAEAETPAVPPPPPTEPPAPATRTPEDRPSGQIVSIPPPPREQVPDHADKVSEYNSATDHEQVSAFNGVPTPNMERGNVPTVSGGDDKNGNTTDPAVATKERPKAHQTPAARATPGTGETDRDPSRTRGENLPPQDEKAGQTTPKSQTVDDPFGTASPTPPAEGDGKAQPKIVAGGAGPLGGTTGPSDYHSLLPTIGPQDMARQDGSIDDLDDVDRGNGTALNTKAYKHAWFFNRLKEEIYEHWDVVRAYRRHDPYGRVYGVRDRITVLRIELEGDGNLRNVYVLHNSGATFLDDVAVQAVREAQPFPNPPRGLADDDGIIRITYRFTLDIESGGFKLF